MTAAPTTPTAPPRALRTAALALALLAAPLGGCVVGPDYAGPGLAVPARFAEAAPGRSSAPGPDGWVARLGDAALSRLVSEALAANPDVEAARARLAEARAARVEAVAGGMPSLGGAASGSRSALAGVGTASSLYQGGFDAGWELDAFGGRARTVEAAGAIVGGRTADLDSVRLSMVGEVARNYYEARGNLSRRALAARSAKAQSSTLALTKARVAGGVGTDVDVGKAEALASGTRANVPVLDLAYRRSLHRIATLTALPVAEIERIVGRGPQVRIPAVPRVGIPAEAVVARPDLRLAERALAAATARVGVAEAGRYPSVRFSGNLSLSAASLGGLATGPAGWGFGPSLDVPILDAGRREAAVEGAQARRAEAVAVYRGAVLSAMEDVETALVAESRERARLADLRRSASAYGRAASLARELYERGTGSFLDVLDAERSLYQAQDTAEQSRVLVATNYVALSKALGGGWQPGGGTVR